MIAVYNEAKSLFLSPYADGPLNFKLNPDGTMNIKNITRFGRSFSIIRIPYSLKLLIHELQTMNIQMRIITEDNVDQLMSMSYSDNVNKLLQDNTTDTKALLTNVRIPKQRKPIGINRESEEVSWDDEEPGEQGEQGELEPREKSGEELVEEGQNSPPYAPDYESPPYAPESPPYAPDYESPSQSNDDYTQIKKIDISTTVPVPVIEEKEKEKEKEEAPSILEVEKEEEEKEGEEGEGKEGKGGEGTNDSTSNSSQKKEIIINIKPDTQTE